ncbi:hypothetical protein Mpal_2422 [Methanosphaerula palustris E1-9c]|uniref:Uncharacterized protein n=2 Tax=Methanosphaerula palustris TaxID=475088 RepID=B8GEK0_METPE|nr:hypothetical protein Mpal_2422 [Methanosphaerula palustris E1-9c]
MWKGVWNDLGNPDFSSKSTMTWNYLNSHPKTNVVFWSWCGEFFSASSANVDMYLSLMDSFEVDYHQVVFVSMTGHLDGTGLSGNLNQWNNQIRAYCRAHDKVLFDFADIESYDPDGNEYLSRGADNGCNYDNWQHNWARAGRTNMMKGWTGVSAVQRKPDR